MLEALKNPETLKGLTETESDIQQRIDKFVVLIVTIITIVMMTITIITIIITLINIAIKTL